MEAVRMLDTIVSSSLNRPFEVSMGRFNTVNIIRSGMFIVLDIRIK